MWKDVDLLVKQLKVEATPEPLRTLHTSCWWYPETPSAINLMKPLSIYPIKHNNVMEVALTVWVMLPFLTSRHLLNTTNGEEGRCWTPQRTDLPSAPELVAVFSSDVSVLVFKLLWMLKFCSTHWSFGIPLWHFAFEQDQLSEATWQGFSCTLHYDNDKMFLHRMFSRIVSCTQITLLHQSTDVSFQVWGVCFLRQTWRRPHLSETNSTWKEEKEALRAKSAWQMDGLMGRLHFISLSLQVLHSNTLLM